MDSLGRSILARFHGTSIEPRTCQPAGTPRGARPQTLAPPHPPVERAPSRTLLTFVWPHPRAREQEPHPAGPVLAEVPPEGVAVEAHPLDGLGDDVVVGAGVGLPQLDGDLEDRALEGRVDPPVLRRLDHRRRCLPPGCHPIPPVPDLLQETGRRYVTSHVPSMKL